jgi:hypothetical protein
VPESLAMERMKKRSSGGGWTYNRWWRGGQIGNPGVKPLLHRAASNFAVHLGLDYEVGECGRWQ